MWDFINITASDNVLIFHNENFIKGKSGQSTWIRFWLALNEAQKRLVGLIKIHRLPLDSKYKHTKRHFVPPKSSQQPRKPCVQSNYIPTLIRRSHTTPQFIQLPRKHPPPSPFTDGKTRNVFPLHFPRQLKAERARETISDINFRSGERQTHSRHAISPRRRDEFSRHASFCLGPWPNACVYAGKVGIIVCWMRIMCGGTFVCFPWGCCGSLVEAWWLFALFVWWIWWKSGRCCVRAYRMGKVGMLGKICTA